MARAVFLDRDGTLNIEKGYIRQVADLELIPGTAAALASLNQAGVLTILTTNQTGAARGFYDETHIQALNQRVQDLLAEDANAHLDAVFYCPHYLRGQVPEYALDCDCRKPKIGMITAACQQFPQITLSESFVIGDKASDIEFAKNAGCKSILVKTGYGQAVLDGRYQQLTHEPDFICESIVEAAAMICTLTAAEEVPHG